MSENIDRGAARRYLFFGWVLATALLIGVEFVGTVAAMKVRGEGYFRYFVPLVLILPFIAGIQTYRRIERLSPSAGVRSDLIKRISYHLLEVVICAYVGFVVLLGLAAKALR